MKEVFEVSIIRVGNIGLDTFKPFKNEDIKNKSC